MATTAKKSTAEKSSDATATANPSRGRQDPSPSPTSTQNIDPRQISYMPLEQLKRDPKNPKNHDHQVIDDSIGRFGMLDLIVQDQRTGYIVSGHGRHHVLTQMQARGETPPEGVTTTEDGDWLVPVVTGWASRTDSEASAALIALNRTSELGGWVDESLLSLLSDLEEADPDNHSSLVGVGFDSDEIDSLREQLHVAESDSFLDDLAEDGQVSGSFAAEPAPSAQVELKLSMSAADRDETTAILRAVKSHHSLDSLLDAFLLITRTFATALPDSAIPDSLKARLEADPTLIDTADTAPIDAPLHDDTTDIADEGEDDN